MAEKIDDVEDIEGKEVSSDGKGSGDGDTGDNVKTSQVDVVETDDEGMGGDEEKTRDKESVKAATGGGHEKKTSEKAGELDKGSVKAASVGGQVEKTSDSDKADDNETSLAVPMFQKVRVHSLHTIF